MTSHPMRLLLVVAALLGVASGAGVFVPAAGNARNLNGDLQHRQYVQITPRCQADANPFDIVNVTVSIWFRTDHHSSVDQTLFGYAFDRGPLLSLARDGTVIWRGAPLLTDCHYWYDRLGVTVIDGQWHHYALTAGLNFYAAYLDGRVLQNCSGSVDSVVRGSRLHLGVYDPEMHSANSMPFTGEVDDARLYRRLVLDEADLQENVMGRPPTPDELAHDLVLALDFDDDFDDNQITNKAVVSSLILVGGGLKQRSPLLVPSTAPLYGKSDNATIAIMAVQDGSSAPSVTRSLVAMSPRLTESRAMASVADIRIHQIVSTVPNSGVVSIGGVPLTSNMVLNSVANATITFAPSAGVVGVGLMRVYATLTIGAISQDFVVVVSSRANTHPIAGSAGMAAQFDGVDDFYMADHLAWPTKSVNLSGVRTRGLSAITIEFWAWFDETCTGDRAVFALGGNNERYNQWVDSFNALRRSGRWYLTLPDENGNLRWRVDMDEYTTSVTAYYGGWAHYALVHDGIDGVRLAVYINGVQVITDTHPHDGMQGGNLDFNHFTLGTWTFWSEVYHKGVLDEFRLWNYSRSEAEIRRDMYTRLTGAEPNLFAYWNFDDANDPNSDDVVDETRRGNTLRAGGCVSCEPRFYCQPYESVPGPPMDDNNCIPSAKDVTSIYYRTQTCFGGTHCFRGEERTSTHPTPVISEAPIGGFTFDQIGVGGEPVEIVLNGTDPDGDPLAFYIAQQPDRGLWQYETGLGGSWVPFPSAPFTLPIGVSRVRILTNVGDGGHPFAQLRYAARDAFALSATVQVQVQLLCPAGTYLNQDAHRCQPCAPGSYTAQPSTALACTLCPVNHAQPEPGQRSCQRCDPGRTYTTRIGSESCWACNTTSDQVNPALMSLSPTFCSMELVTDNVVATAGGFHSVLDFGALLANLPDADNHRVLLSTIPKHGKLLQVGIDGQLGEDFYDYVVSSIEIEEQYVARVVSATAWLPDRPYNATIGPPDAMRSGSSPLAWAPFANDNGVAQIVVAFEQAVYVTGVVVYENIGGGAVTLIEALDPDERWSVIWSGDPLPIGLAVLRQWQPVVCPTPFRTRTLRLTVNALRCSGRNEIDAIQLQGASELSKSRLMLISNPKQTVAYVPPSSVPLGYSFTDAISYQIQSCRGGDIIQTGVQSLAVKLGNLDVDEVTASSAAIWTAAVAGFVGIVTCLVSAIAIVMCRSKAVIRASSVVFMNIMVLGIATGFGVLLLSAMNAAAPDLLANFCMIRACMFSFAFVLIMGSIVVKTGRIVVIFNLSKGPRALHATNAHLALILFGLVAVDFAILSAGGMSPLLVDTYHISNTYRYRTCSGRGPAAAALIVVSIGYKAVLVVVGIALGVLSRNVPSAFNEVKALSIMTYTIATNSVLYLVVDGVIANPNTSLILITFSLSVSLLSAWISLVGYKFWVVVFRPDCKPNPSSESPVAGIIQQPEAVSKNSRLVTAGPKFNFTATMDGFRQSISGGDFDRYAHQ